MKLFFVLLTPIVKLILLIEKLVYFIREIAWSYPDLFLKQNFFRDRLILTYNSSLPYSHFALSTIITLSLVIILFTAGLPRIIGSDKSILIEGVVMGSTSNGDPQQLNKINPILTSNIQLEKDIVELIYEPLLRFDYVPFEDDKYIGGAEFLLAKSISTIEPGADYIFELRQNVYWHDHIDGSNEKKFTVDDVIATFELLASLDLDISVTRAVNQIKWERMDDYKIRVCTKIDDSETRECSSEGQKPIFSNFLELFTFKILPSHKIGDLNNNNFNDFNHPFYKSPVGTGKYRFSDANSGGINLALNNSYYMYQKYEEDFLELESLIESQVSLTQLSEEFELANSILLKVKESDADKVYIDTSSERFVFEIGIKDDESIYISDMYKTFKSPIDEIRFEYYKDIDSAIAALKNAEIHSITTNSVQYINDLKEFTQINSIQSSVLYNQFWAIYFNLRTRPDGTAIGSEFLLNSKVRKAINHGIDKESIINNILFDVGDIAHGPIPEISFFFNENITWPEFNRALAESLLDQEGWQLRDGSHLRTNSKGSIMSFNLSFVENFDRRRVVESIKADLSKLGIEVIIDRDLMELPEFMMDIKIRNLVASEVFSNSVIQDLEVQGVLSNVNIAKFLYEEGGRFSGSENIGEDVLNQSGWLRGEDGYRYRNGQQMMFNISIVDTPENKLISDELEKIMKSLGIKTSMNFRTSEFGVKSWSLQDLNDQLLAPRLYDSLLYGMDRFIDPEMFELYHSSQSNDPGLNISSYQSEEITVDRRQDRQEGESSLIQVPKVDRFLEQARSFDPVNSRVERKEKYDEIQRILASEVPVIYLYHPQYLYFSNRKVEGIDLSRSKSAEERFRNIQNWSIN